MNKKDLAKIIYNATRLEAIWNKREIVPEKWEDRSKKFKEQFTEIIVQYFKNLPTPREAHNNWVEAYKKMGWKYGYERDPIKKTHPDIKPFEFLPKNEKDKDAVFLAIIFVAREILKLLNEEVYND